MPHLHIKEFKELSFPSSFEGVEFNFIAKNANEYNEELISASFEGDDFFLLLKDEENKTLLKSEKITRPSATYAIHKALLAYAKAAGIEILASNVPDVKRNMHLEEITALKDISYFAQSFPQAKEVRIEVGFGSGRHLLHQAANNPEVLFVGLEIHKPSIEQVLKQISIQKLNNLLLLDYDARLFMELVPSNLVGKIYVHFPVPWDKKPHRRVISRSFVEEAMRVLKVGGTLELRTDSENYYAYSYETMIGFNKISFNVTKNRDIAVSSKYEDRWKRMEKNIYDVTMINDLHSEPLRIEGDFSFSHAKLSHAKILEKHGKTEKFDGGFIHFERIYNLIDGVMMRLSMGSFDRPESLYVIVREGNAGYYPKLPLKSKSNLAAHKLLCEVLRG
ncbi:MAG: tRNA (guanosine(46)-N7)-methyltransferase TrmB [Epsilonproteobacteria bacterium]|nr:tRNA (guanosine(46)-N7)-methyltransferase TrmB [Campylobacterota bacterium]